MTDKTPPIEKQDKVMKILRNCVDNSVGCICIEHKEGECPCSKEIIQARLEIERLMLTEKELRNLLYFNAQGQFRFDDVAQTLFKAQELKFKNGGM